jgi:hypothetical protein
VLAALVLAVWVLLTGGLHLDGLADTADAWIGGQGDRDRTLAIMKDPRSGPMAVVIIVLVLLSKFAALQVLLAGDARTVLLLTPMLGRTVIVLLLITTPYVRPEGLGAAYARLSAATGAAARWFCWWPSPRSDCSTGRVAYCSVCWPAVFSACATGLAEPTGRHHRRYPWALPANWLKPLRCWFRRCWWTALNALAAASGICPGSFPSPSLLTSFFVVKNIRLSANILKTLYLPVQGENVTMPKYQPRSLLLCWGLLAAAPAA